MLGKIDSRPAPGGRPRDGRHCDLCGCSQPAVRCDKCGCQIFCLSCDDMYHRHPKRRFHLRKAVDPSPPVPQARPVLPLKAAQMSAAVNPGDPSKMPLPPPRKKKPSIFSSFRRRGPASESPSIPKKEYSWIDRVGNIKKFMSNRPLPPVPTADDDQLDGQPTTNGHTNSRGDLSFIHKRNDERPPQLPSRSPRPADTSRQPQDRISSDPSHLAPQMQNGSFDIHRDHFSQNGHQAVGTIRQQHQGAFIPQAGPGYPGGMHQSSSAADLQSLQPDATPHGHFPHYPMGPHMVPPHYPYPVYPPQVPPGYPHPYFGGSFANLSNPATTDGEASDQSEGQPAARHRSKQHPFRKRAKRSQSVMMMDRMAYNAQFYPFGPYPGYGPWGATPFPMETPPSPASSVSSLNRIGKGRRKKKTTASEDEDEAFSLSSSPLSRPKSSSSDRPMDRKDIPRRVVPVASSSEEESDEDAHHRRSKVSTIQRRQSDTTKTPASPATDRRRPPKLKRRSSSKQSDSEPQDGPRVPTERRTSRESTDQPLAKQPSSSSSTWECKHCTFANPAGTRICQVCCKTASPRSGTPVASGSRPASRAEASGGSKQAVGSDRGMGQAEKEKVGQEDDSRKDKQEMAILNSALDEAEKEISRGLEELMKLKDDIDGKAAQDSKPEAGESPRPVYKSSGRMRTSILDKLTVRKPQTASTSTTTDVQTGWTADKVIEARRPSNSSTASGEYNSPLARSPSELSEALKQKRDSSCQTQAEDSGSLAEYLERKRAADEAYTGRPGSNFGFGDRLDAMSPVPAMYERYLGGGLGMMQRAHSRASLYPARMSEFGPVDYGGLGYGCGPAPMFRSLSRGSLLGEYPDVRMSEFHNLRKPDYYLSMEELVERRRQENMRAQGLELVRMIREAEQQGFTADDIQVALTHCGKMNPLDWLQDNWRNMLDSVVTLATNYGNDKKDNDVGLVSEAEAREALRVHKGNIWAAVTECVEGRQKKHLELSVRGKFSTKDIVEALNACEGDVEMAYARLSKSSDRPFLMRIWGSGEGIQNQDVPHPRLEDSRERQEVLQKEDFGSDQLSEEAWSDDGAGAGIDWEDEYEDERDLHTCREDLQNGGQEDMVTPESDRSEYADASAGRDASSPASDVFFVIPEGRQEKRTGFLGKLAALRKDGKEKDETLLYADDDAGGDLDDRGKPETSKPGGALSTLKNTFSAIRDTVTGASRADRRVPCSQPERRTIVVKGHLGHESLGADRNVTLTAIRPLADDFSDGTSKPEKPAENHEKANQLPVGKDRGDEYKSSQEAGSAKPFQEAAGSSKQEIKRRQSLTERLKFAKQVYASRTNLNSTAAENDVSVPSTSKLSYDTVGATPINFQKQSSSAAGSDSKMPENFLDDAVFADAAKGSKKQNGERLNEALLKSLEEKQPTGNVEVPVEQSIVNESHLQKESSEISTTTAESQPREPSRTSVQETMEKSIDKSDIASNAREVIHHSLPKMETTFQTKSEENIPTQPLPPENVGNQKDYLPAQQDLELLESEHKNSSSTKKLTNTESLGESLAVKVSDTNVSIPNKMNGTTYVENNSAQEIVKTTVGEPKNSPSTESRDNEAVHKLAIETEIGNALQNIEKTKISSSTASEQDKSENQESSSEEILKSTTAVKPLEPMQSAKSVESNASKDSSPGQILEQGNVSGNLDKNQDGKEHEQTTTKAETSLNKQLVSSVQPAAEDKKSVKPKTKTGKLKKSKSQNKEMTDLGKATTSANTGESPPIPVSNDTRPRINLEEKVITNNIMISSSPPLANKVDLIVSTIETKTSAEDLLVDNVGDNAIGVEVLNKDSANAKFGKQTREDQLAITPASESKAEENQIISVGSSEESVALELTRVEQKELISSVPFNSSANSDTVEKTENAVDLKVSVENGNTAILNTPVNIENKQSSASYGAKSSQPNSTDMELQKAIYAKEFPLPKNIKMEAGSKSSDDQPPDPSSSRNRTTLGSTSTALDHFAEPPLAPSKTPASPTKHSTAVSDLSDGPTSQVSGQKAHLDTSSVDKPESEYDNVANQAPPLSRSSVDNPESETDNVTNQKTHLSRSSVDKSESETDNVTNQKTHLSRNSVDKPDSETENVASQKSHLSRSSVDKPESETDNVANQKTHLSRSSVDKSETDDSFRTVDSDNDTDLQVSDDSRPNSVTPPSPVDALRSRFEGMAGGARRPQSPFRRMSFNSRKQAIALEKIRDRSLEKPWYKRRANEPVKLPVPKRTIKQQLEMERRVRKLVQDRKVGTYRKAEVVVQLLDLNFEEEEALQAAAECSTLEMAISYLQQECQLCAGHYPASQIVSMTHCQHRACRECVRAYFTVQIRDRTILDLLCPFCSEPDIGDEDVAQDYFNHLDIMLKKLVDENIHELFQRKLRDRVLMKDPNFRWCSQCSSGFIAMPNLTRLVCPDCNAVTCASCRRLWEREHQGMSCEAFAKLKDASDVESQAAGLAKMLQEDGIDCPNCHFRYALAKGGCMHFRCIQCQHDFCSGCSRPFKMGQRCGVSEFCGKLGLHAHHPRNCLFYLRDKDPEDLQKLLEMNSIKYNTNPPEGVETSNACRVMEQKETTNGMVDDFCGKEVQEGYAGLCRLHYVEYLGQLVNRNKVDPIQIFDNDDLELVLRRANIRLPPRRYRESELQYREKLVKVIEEELPLDKTDGS